MFYMFGQPPLWCTTEEANIEKCYTKIRPCQNSGVFELCLLTDNAIWNNNTNPQDTLGDSDKQSTDIWYMSISSVPRSYHFLLFVATLI